MRRDRLPRWRELLALSLVLVVASVAGLIWTATRSTQPASRGSDPQPTARESVQPASDAPSTTSSADSPPIVDIAGRRFADDVGDASDRAGRDIVDVELGADSSMVQVGVRFAAPVATPATILVDVDTDAQLRTGCDVNLSVGFEVELAVDVAARTASVRACRADASTSLAALGGAVSVERRFVLVSVPRTAIPLAGPTLRVSVRSSSMVGTLPRYWDSAPENSVLGFPVRLPD